MPTVNKNIPNCLNCNSPFSEEDQYCSNCSQKRTDGLISVKDLFSDFFSTVFNIDGKLVNTIKDLFIPGKLTTAFFAGHHEKYYKPLRMFFVFMVANFAILSLTIFSNTNIGSDTIGSALEKIQYNKEIKLNLDTILLNQRQHFNGEKEKIVLDSIESTLNTRYFSQTDSVVFTEVLNGIGEGVVFDINLQDYKIAVDDIALIENDFEAFAKKYDLTDFTEKLTLQQAYRVANDPKGTFNYVFGNMTWMLILLIPVIAIVLKLLYIRNNLYFVQHLAFLFHNHAFAFLIISIAALADYFINNEEFGVILSAVVVLGLIIYLFVAMKRFYGQSFFKTLIKFFIVLISYVFISLTFFLITILFSFALYS